jgi:putative addiction module component (TIGR02574 family)
MRRVEGLQQQILALSREEFAELRVWIWEKDSIAWDEPMEADSNSVKLDKLASEVSQRRHCELADGKVAGVPGPEVLSRLRADLPPSPRMNDGLRKLPLEERIRLVKDLWDSIAADQNLLPLTPEQRAELDRCLDAYKASGRQSRPAEDVIAEIKKKL